MTLYLVGLILTSSNQARTSPTSTALLSTKEQITAQLDKHSKARWKFDSDMKIQDVLLTQLIGAYCLGDATFQKHPTWVVPGERAATAKTQSQNIRALQAWWMLRVGLLTFPDLDDPYAKASRVSRRNPDGTSYFYYDFSKGHPMTLAGDKVMKSLSQENSHAFFYEVCRYWGKNKYGIPTKAELEKAMGTAPKDLRYLLIGALATIEAKENQKVRWWVEWKNLLKNQNRPLLVQHMYDKSKVLQGS